MIVDSSVLADTVSAVVSVAGEPWWAKYAFELLMGSVGLLVPAFVAWRAKQNARTQAIADAVFVAFNHVEKAFSVVKKKKTPSTKKLIEFLKKASEEYAKDTGHDPNENDLKRMRKAVERLIFDRNSVKKK